MCMSSWAMRVVCICIEVPRRRMKMPAKKYEPVHYDEDQVRKMLTGYIEAEHWDLIPLNTHIRYLQKGDDEIGWRFKPGGFLKNIYVDDQGYKRMMIGNFVDTSPQIKDRATTFTVLFANTEKVWQQIQNYDMLSKFNDRIKKLEKMIAELNKR